MAPTTRNRDAPRAIAGVLPDGTVYYVRRGEIRRDGTTMCCHLCGFWFRSLVRHLSTHEWTAQRYVSAFALESVRQLSDSPASPPEQATGGVDCPHAGRGPRRGGRSRREQLDHAAATAARQVGASGIGEYVLSGVASGLSLAELSARAGLSRQWLDRHLEDVAPDAAREVRSLRRGEGAASEHPGNRWLARLADLGFDDPAVYLHTRRSAGWSWSQIAVEGEVNQRWLLRRREILATDPTTPAGPARPAPAVVRASHGRGR